MKDSEDLDITRFIDATIQHFKQRSASGIRVLDFGCGTGTLVANLARAGYAAYGCDVDPYWDSKAEHAARLETIQREPYRLPYEKGSFDFVVSTSVLEHAQNKRELFGEIHRVLATGGVAIHLYPSKWYLPVEPHIYVPLVNMFWPNCPRWWLSLWAWLGIRNEFQTEMGWKATRTDNQRYCNRGLSYWSHGMYRKLSMDVFGNYHDATGLLARWGYGGLVGLSRRLHLPASVTAFVSSTFRMSLLVSRKEA